MKYLTEAEYKELKRISDLSFELNLKINEENNKLDVRTQLSEWKKTIPWFNEYSFINEIYEEEWDDDVLIRKSRFTWNFEMFEYYNNAISWINEQGFKIIPNK